MSGGGQNSRGSIDRLPSGRHRARVRINGKRVSRSFSTREEAEAFCERGTEVAERQGREPLSPTLESFAEEVIERRAMTGYYMGIENEFSILRTYIKGTALGATPLAKVTCGMAARWFDDVQRKKALHVVRTRDGARLIETDRVISESRARQARAVLGTVIKEALARDMMFTNVMSGIIMRRRPPVDSEAWTVLEPFEIERIRRSTSIPVEQRTIFIVAIYTGLRERELWGLRWTDVETEGPDPHITLRRSGEGQTKNKKCRFVPLFEPARQALQRWKKIWRRNDGNLVFPSADKAMRPQSDDAGWADHPRNVTRDGVKRLIVDPGWKTRAGITRDVRFHDFRHTCASMLLRGCWGRPWTLPEIRDLLGHGRLEETTRYAHLSSAHLSAAAKDTAPNGD